MTKQYNYTEKTEARFWSKVDAKPGDLEGCWDWTAYASGDGYGIFWDGENYVRAHRYAYELANGEIPNGMHICHRCDNPGCVNSRHLFLGTNAGDMADRNKKGRQAQGERSGARLHPEKMPRPGVRNGQAKLDDLKVREIRGMYATGGITQVKLAKFFGVHVSTICDVVNRKIWAHVP